MKILENGILFFAQKDENGRILSFCTVRPTEFEWEIYDIETIIEARKKGFAKKVLTEVFAAARKENAGKIFLEVRESNIPAINLYKNFGFTQYLVRKHYYADNGENALCMVATL